MVLAQDLRNAVLQAAFQGKLTTQNISSFVKYGIGQNGTFSQDGLFDIPQNWQWKKFSDLCINISTGPFGTMLHKTDYESSGIPLVNPVHMINGNIVPSDNAKVSKEKYKELRRYVLHDGDIVIARRGELGRVAVVTSNEDGWLCGTGSFFITPKDSVDARYLILFFSVPYVRFALLGDSVGTTMNNLNQSLLKKLPIPFPPIEEQRRIVERVNAIMAQIDEYEKIEQELAKLKADFPSDMKAAILQAAMQGKLTEQLDTDSSVEDLLSRVYEEKRKLVENGELRNLQEPSSVDESEIPFEIPQSWIWVKLPMIAQSGLGKTLNKHTDTGEEKPYLCSINVYTTGINLETVKTSLFAPSDIKKYRLKKYDWLICEGGDTGRSCIWESDAEMYYQNALHRVRFFGDIVPYFYNYVMILYKLNGLVSKYSKGETIQHLVQTGLHSMPLPLPPIEEQQRIVEQLNALLPLCENLCV